MKRHISIVYITLDHPHEKSAPYRFSHRGPLYGLVVGRLDGCVLGFAEWIGEVGWWDFGAFVFRGLGGSVLD